MIIVTLARKPLDRSTVAANVLEHSTGALNIDGTRLGVDGGRWPANLILQHTPECRRTGTKRVKTSVNHHMSKVRFAGTHGIYGKGAGGRGHDYADADGKETIDAWQCTSDCPIAHLDESGDRRSAGHYPTTYSNGGGYTRGDIGHGVQGPLYADAGGASRFFKQVGGSETEPCTS